MNNEILKNKFGHTKNTVWEPSFRRQLRKALKTKGVAAGEKIFNIIKELENFNIPKQYHNHVLHDGKTYELPVEKDLLLLYRYEGIDLYIDLILLDLTNHKHLNNKLEDDLDINLTENISSKLELLLKKYPDAYIPKYDKASGLPILPKAEYGDWEY